MTDWPLIDLMLFAAVIAASYPLLFWLAIRWTTRRGRRLSRAVSRGEIVRGRMGGATMVDKRCPVCGGEGRIRTIAGGWSGDKPFEPGDWLPCALCAGKAQDAMERKLCPVCGGEGRIRAIVCERGRNCRVQWLDCSLCAGNGEVDASHLERIRSGEALRADRVRRRVSLREAAAEMGISPAELSRRENGRK